MPRRKRFDVSKPDPSLKPLGPREERLVQATIAIALEGRTITKTELAKAAGYSEKGDAGRVQVWRALQRPNVRARLMQEMKAAAEASAPHALAAIRHIVDKGSSEKSRLDAAKAALELAGMLGNGGAPTGAGVSLHIHLSDGATLPAPRIIEGTEP